MMTLRDKNFRREGKVLVKQEEVKQWTSVHWRLEHENLTSDAVGFVVSVLLVGKDACRYRADACDLQPPVWACMQFGHFYAQLAARVRARMGSSNSRLHLLVRVTILAGMSTVLFVN